jgi:hypothetical protein
MYYVTMTDKFMSHISGMSNKQTTTNKLVIVCKDYTEAETVERNANKRTDMKHINIRSSKPYYGKNYSVSFKTYDELGDIWKQK